jgi:hypothetical protein
MVICPAPCAHTTVMLPALQDDTASNLSISLTYCLSLAEPVPVQPLPVIWLDILSNAHPALDSLPIRSWPAYNYRKRA